MKSLLRTAPKVEESKIWGVKAWTNLKSLHELFSGPSPVHPIVHKLSDLFANIEAHDIKVGTTSIIRRGKRLAFRVYPRRGHGTPAKAQEHEVDLIECSECAEICYPETEKDLLSHKKECAFLLAVEVMET